MTGSTIERHSSVRTGEYVLWTAAVLVGGFFVPGLGLLIGAVLAFTRLRAAPPAQRWGLLAVGVALLAVQVVGLNAGFTEHHVSPATRVS